MVKRRLLYGLALLVLWIFYILTDGYGVFVVLAIMVVLPFVSVGYALFVRDKIKLTIADVPKTLIRGEKLKYQLTVKNEAYTEVSNINMIVSYYYNNFDVVSEELFNISVEGTEKEHVNGEIRLNHIGEIYVTTKGTHILDPLQMFKLPIRQECNCNITVMPVLNEPDYYALYNPMDDNMDSTEYSKKRKGDDPSEIFDIRGYVSGDSLNRVHWKLSAKEDELLIKEFSHPITKSNCILLEMHKFDNEDSRRNLDGVFEMAYAIGNLACVKEKEFKLAYYCVKTDELRVFDVLSYEELTEAMRIIVSEKTYDGDKALEYYLASEAAGVEKLYYITDICGDRVYELEEIIEAQCCIYNVNGSEETGKVTQLIRNTIMDVDRDDIRWGLSNTSM